MSLDLYDFAVIGSGPGGYEAAIRAAQLGLKTVCVEKAELGGICLNWGCVPTKALLKSAEYVYWLNEAEKFGAKIKDFSIDFERVIERSREVANRMSSGVAYLFKKYKVETAVGFGYLKSKNEIEVRDESGKAIRTIKAKNIVVATGARPRAIPGIETDGEKILVSKDALVLKRIPKSIIVIGAGAIGVEFAYFFGAFGAEITIIEALDRILPLSDKDLSKELSRHFRKRKFKIKTGAKVLSAKAAEDGAEVVVQTKDGKEETLKADLALNAIGVQANVENIGLENVGVKLERGYIATDEFSRTNVEGVFAIGDVAGPPQLAHKASAEGVRCAELVAGENPEPANRDLIPSAVYCQPQVASVGLTEEKAIELGRKIKIGKFPFAANGKARGIGETGGFVKLIFDEGTEELLGAHMIGPETTELLGEAVLAINAKASAKDFAKAIHAHPTLSEALMEAAAQARNECVNL